jgi:acetyl-CoA carboxylase biotin carboxyl carrier protein
MDIESIKKLLNLFKESGLSELIVKQNELEVSMKADLSSKKLATDCLPMKEISNIDLGHLVQSSMVGTFYRGVSPDSDPFVEAGDKVSKGDTLAIIEAMKVINEIKAERDGFIKEIRAKDGDPIEFGTLLFVMA